MFPSIAVGFMNIFLREQPPPGTRVTSLEPLFPFKHSKLVPMAGYHCVNLVTASRPLSQYAFLTYSQSVAQTESVSAGLH